MAKSNSQESVAKYESFINDVLKEDLQGLQVRLQQVNEETADLIQQRHTLKVVTNKEVHPTGFKTQINLGCNFFMEAAVADTSTMLVNLGLNHYLELSLIEATAFLDARINYLEKVSEQLRKKAAEVKAHLKVMLVSMSQIHEQETKS